MRTLAIIAFIFFALTSTAFAQVVVPAGGTKAAVPAGGTVGTPTQNVTLINPLQGGGTLEAFLNSILAFVIRIGTIAVILMLVYIGYLFVAARGNAGKLEEARRALLWTVIGALILLGAVVIKDGIMATVNSLSTGR